MPLLPKISQLLHETLLVTSQLRMSKFHGGFGDICFYPLFRKTPKGWANFQDAQKLHDGSSNVGMWMFPGKNEDRNLKMKVPWSFWKSCAGSMLVLEDVLTECFFVFYNYNLGCPYMFTNSSGNEIYQGFWNHLKPQDEIKFSPLTGFLRILMTMITQ